MASPYGSPGPYGWPATGPSGSPPGESFDGGNASVTPDGKVHSGGKTYESKSDYKAGKSGKK